MTDSRNFEALGRYVDAKEKVSEIDTRRHNLAGEISRLLSKASVVNSSDRVSKFDHALFLSKAEELVLLSQDLNSAVEQVNMYAGPAGKQGIKLV